MIQLTAIERTFIVGGQPIHALDHVSFDAKRGDYISIMGPSGSGKSTLLNILGLLDRPDSGTYHLDGRDVTSVSFSEEEQARTRREKIGFVFQFFHLIPRLTAAQNIELPMLLAGMPVAERKARVTQASEAVGIADRLQHRPEQLSGGQRQRVAIARATVMQAPILLADEPTGNLDRHSGLEVVELLERLHANSSTLIIVTHDPELGRRASRQIRMQDGQIVSQRQ